MPSDKDFKKLVRDRMARTGESYSIARLHLVGPPAKPMPIGTALALADAGPGVIYQIKVSIDDIDPTVWRRIHVPADISLHQLAGVLIAALGWRNSHLHQFTIGEVLFGEPEHDDLDDEAPKVRDEKYVRLRHLEAAGTRKFGFLYDFGDCWRHTIQIESVDVEPKPGALYPMCAAGERACPPEDCGGTSGYAKVLEILHDRTHPDHEEMKLWVGRGYDPERFKLDSTNAKLRRLAGLRSAVGAYPGITH